MNRIVTSALGMLVIAGVLYRPPVTGVGPTPGTESPKTSRGNATHQQPGRGGQPQEPPAKNSQSATGVDRCIDASGPWDKIPEYFGEAAGKNKPSASDRFQDNLKEAYNIEQYQLQYLIATLADPVHTNLPLYFDREIEAILRAATEIGYDFDRYWLPWSTDALPEEPNCYWRSLRDQRTEEREQLPGLMIFRKAGPSAQTPDQEQRSQLLFVFLVAETPTSGINKTQFLRAVEYIRDLKGNALPPEAIPILGPSFSGSVNSLILAVKAFENQPKACRSDSGFPAARLPIQRPFAAW